MDASVGPEAPGQLELVRAFVNTRDVEACLEHLGSPADLDEWARSMDLDVPSATEGELARLIELREALRSVLCTHHDGDSADDALAVIDGAMRWGEVRPRLSATDLDFTSVTGGAAGLVGNLLANVASTAATGTWQRLKACRNDACRWAFYDHSRSRTGRWCSMQVCGNRAKQQRFHRGTAM